MMDNDFTRR